MHPHRFEYLFKLLESKRPSGLDLGDLRALYARHRVRLLVNEHAAYRSGDRTVQVTGLDDFTGG
jgi:hypothetical protein